MKKYFTAVLYIFCSFIRFSFLRVFHKTFSFSMVSLVSPFVGFDIGRNACVTLGKLIKIRSGTKINIRKNATLTIGENSFINHGCIITSHERITIGNNVQIGPNVLIYDHDHDYKSENGMKDMKFLTSQVEIGDNVWIGGNTIILRGTKIGNNCIIGAGSVIKGSYEDNTVVLQKRDTSIYKY